MKLKKVLFVKIVGRRAQNGWGNCHTLGEWNTYIEEIEKLPIKQSQLRNLSGLKKKKSISKPIPLKQVLPNAQERLVTIDAEFNRALGVVVSFPDP